MTRQGYAVFSAPCAAGVGKCLGEALRNMVVIIVSRRRYPALGQIPEKLGELIDYAEAVGSLKGLRQVVRPREDNIVPVRRIAEGLLAGELRLVGEDRRHGAAEFVADRLGVALVSDLDEALYRLFIKSVDIGLIVIPRRGGVDLEIGVPFDTLGIIIFADAFVIGEVAVAVKPHVVAGDEIALAVPAALGA